MSRKGPTHRYGERAIPARTLLKPLLVIVCGALMAFVGFLGALAATFQIHPSAVAAKLLIVVLFVGLAVIVVGAFFLVLILVRRRR